MTFRVKVPVFFVIQAVPACTFYVFDCIFIDQDVIVRAIFKIVCRVNVNSRPVYSNSPACYVKFFNKHIAVILVQPDRTDVHLHRLIKQNGACLGHSYIGCLVRRIKVYGFRRCR